MFIGGIQHYGQSTPKKLKLWYSSSCQLLVEMAKRLIPSLNRVLVEKIVPPSKTSAGILLPEKSSKVPSLFLHFVVWIRISIRESVWLVLVLWPPAAAAQLREGGGGGAGDEGQQWEPDSSIRQGRRYCSIARVRRDASQPRRQRVSEVSELISPHRCSSAGPSSGGDSRLINAWKMFYRYHLYRDEDILGTLHDWWGKAPAQWLQFTELDGERQIS